MYFKLYIILKCFNKILLKEQPNVNKLGREQNVTTGNTKFTGVYKS